MAKNDDPMFEGGDTALNMNLTAVEEAKFELLPNGIYPVTITDSEFKYAASSGAPMWAVQGEVTEGEFAGRKLFTNIVFSEKALPFAKKTLAVLKPSLCEGDFNMGTDAPQLIGEKCRFQVTAKKHEGVVRNQVSEVLAEGGDGFDA